MAEKVSNDPVQPVQQELTPRASVIFSSILGPEFSCFRSHSKMYMIYDTLCKRVIFEYVLDGIFFMDYPE